MDVQVRVLGPSGEEKYIELCDTEFKRITVLQLKEKIQSVFGLSDDVHLIFRDKHLQENALLFDYGIRHMSLIQVIRRLPGGGGPGIGDGGMGDREGRNQSMERLQDFQKCTVL